VFTVFLAHLGRDVGAEAPHLATLLGTTEYEARLALAAPAPAIMVHAAERDRAAECVAALRGRGHGAHAFDDELLVPSERMVKLDDFRFEVDGVRRRADDELLGFGDVFAILRAVHDTVRESERPAPAQRAIGNILERFSPTPENLRLGTRHEERESVAYMFRRSGERPWILRERHANYAGLGGERTPVAFANFNRTLDRLAASCTNAIVDDRLLRRRVAERASPGMPMRSSRQGMDLLAHLLACMIGSQNGSPYR
jgi:hypothetical protein